jgi:hypothetical protein
MVERREMIGGGLLAGLTGMLPAPAAAAAPVAADDTSEAAARAIDRLRNEAERFHAVVAPGTFVAAVRAQQRTFLRANQKYPDYIEVGLGVWEDVYDWHVRHLQQINAARLPDGRYTLAFMFTNLILRPDQAVEYVGFGFDGDPTRRP